MPKKRDHSNSPSSPNTPENLSLFDKETMNTLEAEENAAEETSTPEALDPSPTMEEWQSLYTAAIRFRNLAPWTWMYEDELFAVVNPEDGETGYCSIMGAGGEFFALSVYRGDEGLAYYERISSHSRHDTEDRGSLDHLNVFLTQKSLMVSFEGREDVHQRDREVFKSLDLRFRGRQAWPIVRSYEPGCAPWFVSAQECRFLTCALEQAILVAKRVKQSPELLDSHPGCMLTRVNVSADNDGQDQKPDGSEKGGTWEDQWPAWPYVEEEVYDEIDVTEINEIRLQRALRSATPSGAWEIDISYAPFPVQEDDRPYYPLIMMCVDSSSGMVLNVYPAERGALWEVFVDKFIETIEQIHMYPEHIVVCRDEVGQLFQPVANSTGADLLMAEFLPGVEELRESLANSM